MTSDAKLAVIVGGAIAALVGYDYLSSSSGSGGGLLGSASPVAVIGSDASSAILGAISSFENVASQHNNPGGICGSFSGGTCLGPATFDSFEEGENAALAKIQSWVGANPAMTVAQFVEKWSGAAGSTLENYISSVSDSLGLDPTDPISAAQGLGDGVASDGSAGFDSADGVNF